MITNASLLNQRSLWVVAEGSGLFPLGALVQSDGFFSSVADSRSARNTAGEQRQIAVLVPDPAALAARLRGTGWGVVWEGGKTPEDARVIKKLL